MQPEAVTARLVAGDDLRRPAEPPRSLHPLLFDQRHQLVRIASLDAIDADLIGNRRVQGDDPRCLAKLQRNEKLGLLLLAVDCRNGIAQGVHGGLPVRLSDLRTLTQAQPSVCPIGSFVRPEEPILSSRPDFCRARRARSVKDGA